jgi:hypothetical protein
VRLLVPVALAVALAAGSAAAEETATFLGDGVYTLPDGCAKLGRIARGGPQNVHTVPETLTAKGFESWEAACEFTKITVENPDRVWIAEVKCMEGPDEWTTINRFERIDADTYRVTVEGEVSIYKRCDLPAPAQKNK